MVGNSVFDDVFYQPDTRKDKRTYMYETRSPDVALCKSQEWNAPPHPPLVTGQAFAIVCLSILFQQNHGKIRQVLIFFAKPNLHNSPVVTPANRPEISFKLNEFTVYRYLKHQRTFIF